MNLSGVGKAIRVGLKTHYPLILTAVAGIGTVTTAYLAARAGYQSAKLLDIKEELNGISDDRMERVVDRTKIVWKLYIPPAASAVATIGCLVLANRMETRKTLAAQSALAITQQLYSDYRYYVAEELGASKDQAIRDKIADNVIRQNPPPAKEVLITGPGNVLCCELYTRRYFTCDAETLRRAENEINKRMLNHDYATLDDFYWVVGLKGTTKSGETGWRVGRSLELEFTSVLTEDDRPCLAFEYNYVTTF